MRIAAIVLTAPRPVSMLEQTLKSLAAAGFGGSPADEPRVYEDATSAGQFRSYMEALRLSLRQEPDADAHLVVEDDVVFCRGLREYLERTLWPGPVEQIALCSPYCPKAYRQDRPGWSDAQSGRGLYLAGSQAWVFPPGAARAVLAEVAPRRTTHAADWEIGNWACKTGRTVWYHTPSLAQHEGVENSSLGNSGQSDIRLAADFIGEDADAMSSHLCLP
jgi:hypothetical protein